MFGRVATADTDLRFQDQKENDQAAKTISRRLARTSNIALVGGANSPRPFAIQRSTIGSRVMKIAPKNRTRTLPSHR